MDALFVPKNIKCSSGGIETRNINCNLDDATLKNSDFIVKNNEECRSTEEANR